MSDGLDGLTPAARVTVTVRTIHDIARLMGLHEAQAVPDYDGGTALYYHGPKDFPDGGSTRLGAILVSGEDECVLYLRDRKAPSTEVTTVGSLAVALGTIRDFIRVSE